MLLSPLLERFRIHVGELNISAREKEDYLRGVAKGMEADMAEREKIYAKEKDWFRQSIDLYQFMLENKESYVVRKDQVSSPSPEFRNTFASKQSQALAVQKDFLAQEAEFHTEQKSRLQKMGLQNTDLGVHKNDEGAPESTPIK